MMEMRGNLSALLRGSLTLYVSREGIEKQGKRHWPLTAVPSPQTPYDALVALQHCHILRVSKAFIGYPKKRYSKQATAKNDFFAGLSRR